MDARRGAVQTALVLGQLQLLPSWLSSFQLFQAKLIGESSTAFLCSLGCPHPGCFSLSKPGRLWKK